MKKNIGKELSIVAKQKGICEEWYKELRKETDIENLVDMYFRGIDFCLSNDFPTNEYLKERFNGDLRRFSIYVDEDIDSTNDRRLVALGSSAGHVSIGGYNVSEIFVKHQSQLRVNAKEKSFVVIDMFDDSDVMIAATGDAKVCVNLYGGKIMTDKSDNAVVKVIQKNKKTY